MLCDFVQTPSFKNFRGTVEMIDNERYVTSGEVAVLDDQTIEITELPIRTWTQTYKETVLEPMLQGTDKTPAFITSVFVMISGCMYSVRLWSIMV